MEFEANEDDLADAAKALAAGNKLEGAAAVAGVLTTLATGQPIAGGAVHGAAMRIGQHLCNTATQRFLAAGEVWDNEQAKTKALQRLLFDAVVEVVGTMKEELADRLDEYHDQTLTLIRRDVASAEEQREIKELMRALQKSIDTQQDGTRTPSREVDTFGEVDRLVALGQGEEAERQLAAMKKASLNGRDRARLLTRQAGLVQRSDTAAAGRLLIEAFQTYSDEPVYHVNAVLGFQWLGDPATARKVADEATAKFPADRGVWASWLSAQPVADDDALLQALPAWARGNIETKLALVELRRREGNRSDALRWLNECLAIDKVEAQQACRVALNWLQVSSESPTPLDGARAQVVAAFVERAISSLHGPNRPLEADAWRLRGLCLDMSNKPEEAAKCFQSSLETLPTQETRLSFAEFLLGRGRFREALEQLSRVDPVSNEARYLTAIAKSNDQSPSGLAEACTLLLALLQEGVIDREQVTGPLFDVLISVGRDDDVERLLAEHQRDLSESYFHAQEARLCHHRGQHDEAERHARAAVETQADDDSVNSRRFLAIVLERVGLRREALNIWLQLVASNQLSPDATRLMRLAYNLGEHQLFLERAAALRIAGQHDRQILEAEIGLLDRYDVEECVRVIGEALQKYPEWREVRLRRSLIGYRLGRRELIEVADESLPSALTADPDIGLLVVQLLGRVKETERAIVYAYELVRHNFHSPAAHNALRAAVLFDRSGEEVPASESEDEAEDEAEDAAKTVETNSAVQLTEHKGAVRWYILTDQPPILEQELPLTSGLGQRLLGKKIGEDVILSEGSPKPRTATVTGIQPRYVRLMQDGMDQGEMRFGDENNAFVMHLDDGKGGIDLGPVFEMAARMRAHSDEALAVYRENLCVTLHLLAKRLGRSVLEAMARLVQEPSERLRTTLGTTQDQQEAATSLAEVEGVVVDLTAMITVFFFDLDSALDRSPCRLLVTRATFEQLNNIIANERGNTRAVGFVGEDSESRHIVANSPEAQQHNRRRLDEFSAFIARRLIVEAVPELAQQPHERRELLESTLGWHGTESMILASRAGLMLWTDDLALAHLARHEHSVRSTNTQFFLRHCVARDSLDPSSYDRYSARLLGAGYHFVSTNPSIFAQAGELAEWHTSRPTLQQALRYVASDELVPPFAVSHAASLIAGAFLALALPVSREHFLVEVLTALAQRKDVRRLVPRLKQALPEAFGLNSVRLPEALESIDAWVAAKLIL